MIGRTLRLQFFLFLLLLSVTSLSFAGVHRLISATDNSTNADLCTIPAQVTMVTITTLPFQGGNNVTSTTVTVGGTVVAADVAEIQLLYGGTLEGSVTNPPSLTNIVIPSANNTKGGSNWTYILFLNASAAGKTFNLTVTTLTGSDNAVLPFTTATRTAVACNAAPTINSTQASDGTLPPGLNITTCSGRNVTISATINDADGDPLDWTIYTNSGSGFTPCNSATGVTPPASISCTINGISATTTYYISVTDGSATTLDPAGAPGSFYTITVQSADTSAGAVTAVSSGCTAIDVTAPYTGDCDENNTLSYRYRVSPAGAWVGPTAVSHSASPYSFPISGLTHGETYDVEVTYLDSVVGGTNPQTLSSIHVGANCTGAGTVTAAPTTGVTPSILVTAPYTFDNNGNNTLSYRYRVSPAGGWIGLTPVGHSATPYQITIANLTCGTAYDVEVTYEDGDGIGSGTAVQTVSGINLTSCTGAGTPSGIADSCTQITVSAPFTQDANFDGDTDFEQGPAALGPWTPVCSNVTGSTPRECVDTTVSESTDYYYRLTYQDPDGVSGTAQQVIGPVTTPACPIAITTVGDGTDPGSTSRCPGDGNAELDAFTLSTDTGTDTVTEVTVDFANGTEAGIGLVEITSDDGVTVYGSQATPSDPQLITLGLSINVTTSVVQYKVRITPQSHAAMPAVPGTTYAVTGTVTAVTSTNTKSYNDSTSATVTIDNQSPNNPTWGTITPGNTQITLNWTNPGGDFNEVIILRRQGAAVGDSPAEGTDYSGLEGTAIGSSTIVYVNNGTTVTDTPLTNGQSYYYKIFAKDTCGNYSAGLGTGPHIPGDPAVTPGLPSAVVNSCTQITVSSPFTDDVNGNSTTTVARKEASVCNSGGTWIDVCAGITGASPRTCISGGLTGDTDYCYRITFDDTDGVNGTNPQIIGPVHTVPCGANDTTITANAVTIDACRQLTASTSYTGDADGDGSTLVETGPAAVGPWTTACGALSGASPRQCIIPVSPSTTYYVRFTTSDPDGVTGTNPEVWGPYTTPACGADQDPPTVLFVSPTADAVLGGADQVKIQVWDAGDASPTVEWTVDGGGYSAAALNGFYACGTNCGIWEFSLDTTGYINGPHTITVRATDATGNVSTVSQGVNILNSGVVPAGAGTLLRRTHGSQLCADCHNLATHSSQHTSTKYGSWALDCLRCHTPHGTTNIYLVRESIPTPNSGTHSPIILRDDAATNPDGGYLGNRISDPTNYTDGICETCHTRTSYHRNDTSGADNHTHNAGTRCVNCHTHEDGFAGAGCDGCHGRPPSPAEGDSHAAHVLSSTALESYTDPTPETTAAEYGFACVKCHNGTHVSDPTDPRSVDIAGEATIPDTTGMSYTVDEPGSFTDDPGAGYTFYWSKNACTNVYCHGNFTGGLNPALNWGTSSTTCGTCHKATNADPPTTGSHNPHVISTAYNFDCVTCHRGTASGGSLIDLTVHVNGALNWDLNDEGDARIAAGSTYSGSNTGSTTTFGTFGTCANLYCHSNGNPVTGTINTWTPTWGDPTFPADCTGCHGNDSASASLIGNAAASRDGSLYHEIHVGTYGYNCNDCHDTTIGADNRTIASFAAHVNNAKDVNFASAVPAAGIDQTGGSWDSGTHQCANLYCHSSGQTTGPFGAPLTTPDWDGAALGCNGCHDQAGASTTSLSAAHFTHTETDFYNIGCQRCHINTVSDSTTISTIANHVDGNADGDVVFDNTGPNNSGGTYNTGTETCSNTYCHSDGKDTAAPYISGPSIAWTASATCASCHDDADPAATNLSGAHQKHTETDTYALGCQRCHTNTVSNSTTISNAANHVDGNADGDVVFDNSGPNNSGGTYNTGTEACFNTYCHSDGKDTSAPYTSGPSIAWTAGDTCASCHDQAGASSTNLSAAHFMHTETDGYNLGCQRCHTNTVSNSTTVSNFANHVDGNADGDVAFDSSGVNNSGGAYAPATDTCTNTYCHSNGTDLVAPYTHLASIAWTASRTCASCHGAPPAYGNGSPKANSHDKHTSYSCQTCHNTVVDGTPAIINKGLHVNGVYNVAAGAGASFTASSTPTTCTSNACHGNLTWGSTGSGCWDCHVVSGGAGVDDDVDDYVFGTAPTAIIDGNDWTAYGHGNSTGFSGTGQSGNSAPNFGANNNACKYCHSNSTETIAHGNASNPFRLVNTTGGDGKIGVCLVCHKGGSTGYNPEGIGNINATKKIDDYHAGTDHPEGGGTGDDGGTFCWDCHDPHGDQNWNHATDKLLAYMIQERPVEDHSGSSGWGIPTTYAASSPHFNSTVAGTSSWEWGDYVIDTSFDGLCQVCHDSASHFRSNLYDPLHNPGSRCTSACHKHDASPGTVGNLAFKASGGCKGCHGSETDTTADSVPREQIVGAAALGDPGDDFIRSSRHVSDGSNNEIVTDLDCIVCHSEGGVSSTDTNIVLTGLHENEVVDLRDVDDNSSVAAAWPGKRLGTATITSTNRDDMDSFCLGCHDSDTSSATSGRGGAWDIAVNDSDSGFDTGGASRRMTPFNSSDTQQNANEGATLTTARDGSGVKDVRGAFNYQNLTGRAWASHHNLNQFKLRYETAAGDRNTNNSTHWPTASWTGYTTRENVTLNAGTASSGFAVGLHCSDCHLNESNAHGSRNTFYMLSDSSGNDTAFANVGTDTSTDICSKCHNPAVYGTGNTDTGNSRVTAHNEAGSRCDNIDQGDIAFLGDDGGNNTQITCLGCHGGLSFGMIHGTNGSYNTYKTGTATKMYRFMGTGGSMRWYTPNENKGNKYSSEGDWEVASAGGCYTINAADNWGACTNHLAGRSGVNDNRARPLDY
ncbi:MAG TPA: CxxxxCH/CxxCH domain-containing protein [Thermoanaerobaculia bacterium]|nr:CxxxxCH/CxxCH domain-containing protein [Thermoanaerobaculia bacterium]HUM29120.1 CxxxxCH/CxxCH domain-containing protein [Thermoanaerobaculia bacterium]HXK67497.1 CxxxxCH/CxxCH domain-containing protein [Thermoanaerobaculia bacterium]